MIKQFIKSLREEKEGFSFARPWRLEEKSLGVIIPILRKSREKRDYITFAEAQDSKVEDTGQIDFVFVKNEGKEPILISRGEIFRGKTQERAAIHDHIIPPGESLRVAVRCIHQTRGIQPGSKMGYGGRTPYDVDFGSQSRTWASTSAHYTNVCSAFELNNIFTFTQSDDLVGTIDEMSEALSEVMKKIPFLPNQVGAIFLRENKMVGMDVYNLPLSWDAVKKDVVKKEGATFLKKDEAGMFEFKPEKGTELIKKYLSAPFEEKEIFNRQYKITELRSDALIGEAVEYKGKIIHLTFWQKN